MAFNDIEIGKIKIELNKFIEMRRPPLHIRDEVDLDYRIENQSIIIYEIRKDFMDENGPKLVIDIAKTTYIKSSKKWKLFWMRSDFKWYGYEDNLLSDDLSTVLNVINEDEIGCFWG